ncbi:MAG: hypothetical protein WDN23_15090 [Edaphobacter sp.]
MDCDSRIHEFLAFGECASGIDQQRLTGRGQRSAARLEYLDAQLIFQLTNLATQCGLHNVEVRSRCGECPIFRNADDGSKMAKLQKVIDTHVMLGG